MDMSKVNWIDFYTEFATKLLEYKNNRKLLIEKIIIVYDQTGIKLPRLEASGVPYDIDPFAYLTGILPIKKYGKHSALNMFTEYSMMFPRQLAKYTGFTEEEVQQLCKR